MIVGISCDTPAENLAFRVKFDFPYDLLCDPTRTVSQVYGAADAADTQYPARISYLIDAEGRIEKVYDQVDPAGHPDQVLADIGG